MTTVADIIKQKKAKDNPQMGFYDAVAKVEESLKEHLDTQIAALEDRLNTRIDQALESSRSEDPAKTKIEVNGEGMASLQGPEGPIGPMPEKGVHYFTEADKNELVSGLMDKVTPQKGTHYNDGQPGYSPRRGIDYFTQADIQDFLNKATPQKGVHYKDGERGPAGRNGTNGQNGKDLAPLTTKEVADKWNAAIKAGLISLPDLEAFGKEINKKIDGVARQRQPAMIHGGGMKLKAGAGQTLTRNSDGTWTLTTSAGGVSIETPVGTINSANAAFTVSNTPKYITLNGITYYENDGYTLSGLNITMLVVPTTGSTLRSIY